MSGLAGILRERVAIERRGPERDALGGAVGDWAVLATVAAGVAPDAWGAAAAGEAVAGRPRWRVTMRVRGDVGPGDRLVWKGRTIAIRRRLDDPRTPDRIIIYGEEER